MVEIGENLSSVIVMVCFTIIMAVGFWYAKGDNK